jgi:purine-binding chemotaxis protein CheW
MTEQHAPPAAPPAPVLIAIIGGERYGIDLSHVRGIDMAPRLTRVPGAPPSILGVYLRQGALMVVADPRVPLGLPMGEASEPHYLVVEAGDLEAALLVDAVVEVVELSHEHVCELPSALGDGRIVRRRAVMDDGAVLLLDIPALLNAIARAPTSERGREPAAEL